MSPFHKSAYDYITDYNQFYSGNQSIIHNYYVTLANSLNTQLESGPEKSVAMRKLLESMDAAFRSAAQ